MKKNQKYIIIILLVAFSAIAFGRIAGNDFVNYDDPRLITAHNIVKSGFNTESIKWALTDIRDEYWHPLTSLSLILDWQLFGENATDHHLVSLLWHIGAVLLLFLFLNKTTGQLWPSAFAAAIFALHPLRVESVAWASERKDVLSMFFGMATLYAYAFYVEDRKISKYLLCLFMFILGLMSKPVLVTLPCVMLLLDYWPLGRWPNIQTPPVNAADNASKLSQKMNKNIGTRKKIPILTTKNKQMIKILLAEKAPFFLLSIISSVVLVIGLRAASYMHALDELLLSDRIFNSIIAYIVYLRKFFWPVDLAAFYPYQSIYASWQILGAASILIGITLFVLFFRKKAPFFFVGWFWYLGTLFPVIGLLQTGIQNIADRYTYLPSIGIAMILVWGIIHLAPKEKVRKIILLPAAVLLSIALTIFTWQQCGHWKDSISLWRHAIDVTEDNYFAHTQLGGLLINEKTYDDAITHLNIATKINPFWDEAYNYLGLALMAQGKTEEALNHLSKALTINPYSYKTQISLGIAMAQQGKIEKAMSYFLAALKINPNSADAHFHLANILVKKKEKLQAEYHYRQAIKDNPEHFSAHYQLADILAKKGEREKAIKHFREAARINPSSFHALNNLGVQLEELLRHNEAIHYYRLALPIEPDNPGLHFNMGVALGNKGDLEKAIEHFRRAVELKPDYQDARQALKMALEMQKN